MTAPSRRAQYAQLTRQAILDAARELFTAQGYFGTKVDEIARAAQVAPATVYAVGGGKNGLIRTLIEEGVQDDDSARIMAGIQSATDPRELIDYVVTSTRDKFEAWSGLMRQVVAAAPQEPSVQQSLDIAYAGLRGGLRLTADRLSAMGALRDDVDATRAGDILWIHLCNAAYFVRTDDLGWTLDESAAWLRTTLAEELLKH